MDGVFYEPELSEEDENPNLNLGLDQDGTQQQDREGTQQLRDDGENEDGNKCSKRKRATKLEVVATLPPLEEGSERCCPRSHDPNADGRQRGSTLPRSASSSSSASRPFQNLWLLDS